MKHNFQNLCFGLYHSNIFIYTCSNLTYIYQTSSWNTLFFFFFYFFYFLQTSFHLDLSFDIDLLPPSLDDGDDGGRTSSLLSESSHTSEEDIFSGTATFSLQKFFENKNKNEDEEEKKKEDARKKFPTFDIWIPIHARSTDMEETNSSRDGRWIGALRVCIGKMYVSNEEEKM